MNPKLRLNSIVSELMELHDIAFTISTKNEAEIQRRLHPEVILHLKSILAMAENLDAQFSLRKTA